MISLREALSFILNHITAGPETVVLTERAPGLVPSENVCAPNDIPPFTNSDMDCCLQFYRQRKTINHKPQAT